MSMPPQVVPSGDPPASVTCDTLVVGAFKQDEGPDLGPSAQQVDTVMEGSLAESIRKAGFKGKPGEIWTLPTLGNLAADTVVVVGLGTRDEANMTGVRKAAGNVSRRLGDSGVVCSTLGADIGGGEADAAAVEGFLLGSYRFQTYKSEPTPSRLQRLLFQGADAAHLEQGLARAEAQILARDLINEPAGVLTPETLALRAREVADVGDLEYTVFDENELEARGFGGLMAVAQGSEEPPYLIVMRYVPDDPQGRIALVGKGVTFDSGGLSIKPAQSMETMKTDMAGAAAVVGVMSALRRLRPRVEVLGIIPTTENMTGGAAMRPGDVVRHYGGVSSEVLNTDAEGRLILGDAIAYACEQEVDALVDIATLTGSIQIALGLKATGLFANDDDLATELEQAFDASGERCWRMPLWDDYKSDIDSDIADQKNIGTRWGGSIHAALFLRSFVAPGIPWAHLDIAGPGRSSRDYDETVKGGTGVGTRTLINWVERRGR